MRKLAFKLLQMKLLLHCYGKPATVIFYIFNPLNSSCENLKKWHTKLVGISNFIKVGSHMNFFNAVKICFVKYTNFSDRANRSEYWLFSLFLGIVYTVAWIIDGGPWGPLYSSSLVIFIIPSIAVCVRRLHDVNRSGWWYLLIITIIGCIPLIYWSLRRGDEGDNRFGSEPSAQ